MLKRIEMNSPNKKSTITVDEDQVSGLEAKGFTVVKKGGGTKPAAAKDETISKEDDSS